MEGSLAPSRADRAARVFWPLLAVVLAAGLAIRLTGLEAVVQADGLWLQDPDTVRWLARLRALAAAEHYPVREVLDGFPTGSVSHWTRPMGWVIQALDPLVHWLLPQARPLEAGAACAGPVLALLSTLVVALCGRALLGPLPALCAALLHCLNYSVWNASWLGVGDHQNLQQLLFAGSVGTLLLALRGTASARFGVLAGGLLGAALWVSAEMQVLWLLVAAALVVAELLAPRHAAAQPAREGFVGGLLGVALLGHACEHFADPGAYAWDQLSWLQLHQVLVLVGFVALWRRFRTRATTVRTLAAGAAAVALGLVPFLVAEYRAFGAQVQAARPAASWVGLEVSEFRSAFATGRGASPWPALSRFSWLLPLVPGMVVCVLRHAVWPRHLRMVLAFLLVGTTAAGLWEVKLAHFASAPMALATACSALWLGERAARWSPDWPALRWLPLVLAAAVPPLSGRPTPRGTLAQEQHVDAALRELCTALGSRALPEEQSVLAPWELGAQLMYRARVPVVASGYHRNLAGIHDQYRAFLSTPAETADLQALLRARRVGFVVQWMNRLFLATAPAVLGRTTSYFAADGGLAESVQDTLYWRLRYGPLPAGFTLWYTSKLDLVMPDRSREPAFRVYTVTLPR